mgnify:FL=1
MDKRCKVLWLSHMVPYPPKGGVLQRSYHLIKEVAKYHDVYLVAFKQGALLKTHFSSVDKGLDASSEHLEQFCKEVVYLDIPSEVQRYGRYRLALKGLFSSLGYTNNWLLSKENSTFIESYAKKEKFDLVHYDTISLVPFKKVIPNLRCSLDHHNIESQMMLRRSDMEGNFLAKLYCMQEGLKLRRFERKYCNYFS